MKNIYYTVTIEVQEIYDFTNETKVPLIMHGEQNYAHLYRLFDSQYEAKSFLKMLSYFCTGCKIVVSVAKGIVDEDNTFIGDDDIGSFKLGDEDSEEDALVPVIENIDWDKEVELYKWAKEKLA